jgi:hypothetical protein
MALSPLLKFIELPPYWVRWTEDDLQNLSDDYLEFLHLWLEMKRQLVEDLVEKEKMMAREQLRRQYRQKQQQR